MFQAGSSSETSVRGRKEGSSPAPTTMKANEADDDEVSFKISPVLDDNMIDVSGKELVAQRSKRLRREYEEESKKMVEEEAETSMSPKRQQRSIIQWLKKTPVSSPIAPTDAVADSVKRMSNSSRSSSVSSEVDSVTSSLSKKASSSASHISPIIAKRRGARSPLSPASGSEHASATQPTVAKQRARSAKAVKP